jgi:ParB family chromosome partitioning protein
VPAQATGAPPAAPAPVPAAVAVPVTAPPVDNRERVLRVPLAKIRPSPHQPRKDFASEALKELADSIKEQGIVQPLIVREQADHFELIAGERRWRAAQLIGLAEVPVILRTADDRAVLELALIENLQRENLNAIEEALGYSQLLALFQLTQEVVATKVGKSRAVVANALRLLKLPADVQAFVRDGRISVGHAKVILGLTGEPLQRLAAERIIKENLNVRQTESLVAQMQNQSAAPKRSKSAIAPKDAHVASIENRIRERVGTKVNLRYAKGKGAVEIRFFSDGELERILQLLGVKVE